MNILVYRWGAYTEEDIIFYFKKMNIKVNVFMCHISDKNNDEQFESTLDKNLNDGSYEFVFSVNFFPVIAKVCYKKNIKYISWSYDAPLNVINIEETLGLPNNRVYMFDRMQAAEYTDKGFDNVKHMPLAVPVERYDGIKIAEEEKKKYGADISFVGNLYKDLLGGYISPLDDYDKGYISAVCKAQSGLYGAYIIDDNISDDLINRINKKYREVNPDTQITMTREALSYGMASAVTREERIAVLGVISRIKGLKYFSGEKNEILGSAEYGGRVDYYSEMPKVFKGSTVNMNITLKILKSGIPLRALDIMGCGGFLLSNWQPELAEYFEDEKEMVMYSSIEDAVNKAVYYSNHVDLSKQIALKGYEKTKRLFNYPERINQLINES